MDVTAVNIWLAGVLLFCFLVFFAVFTRDTSRIDRRLVAVFICLSLLLSLDADAPMPMYRAFQKGLVLNALLLGAVFACSGDLSRNNLVLYFGLVVFGAVTFSLSNLYGV